MPTQRFESLGTETEGAANVRSKQLTRGSSPLRSWQFDECDPGWGRPVGKRKSPLTPVDGHRLAPNAGSVHARA